MKSINTGLLILLLFVSFVLGNASKETAPPQKNRKKQREKKKNLQSQRSIVAQNSENSENSVP
jgi:hypothetical protein